MADDPMPTFRSWKDRLVYLLGEYRIPISLTLLSGALWALWARPEVPTPSEPVQAFVVAWALLAIPSYFIAGRLVAWIYDPPMVQVVEVRPGNERRADPYEIPPEIWSEAVKMDDADPMPADGWPDYVVVELEWLGDIRELRIRGCEPEMLDPGAAYAYHEKVDRYYDKHVDLMAAYSKLKAVSAELIQDGHDDGLMQAIGARDKALAPNVSARDLLEEVEREGELAEPGEILEWEDADPEPDGAENGDGELIPEEAIADL